MKTISDFNNLLHELKASNDSVSFENKEDFATASFHHNHFWFTLNGKILFRQKSLRTFRDKIMFKVESKKLQIIK